ncbi:hypothetical protein LCGC14_2620410, partial [marine sediment metagenome]
MVVANPKSLLTGREIEVLDLIVQGWSNIFICTRLHMGPKTVARHISIIYSKYNLSTKGSRQPRVSLVLKHYSDLDNRIPSIDQWEE